MQMKFLILAIFTMLFMMASLIPSAIGSELADMDIGMHSIQQQPNTAHTEDCLTTQEHCLIHSKINQAQTTSLILRNQGIQQELFTDQGLNICLMSILDISMRLDL